MRFAPSPTGLFHVGSARSALFNWFIARQHDDGVFILRIEDTDESRNRQEWEDVIIASMAWLGLNVDVGPYRQSDRRLAHEAARDALLASGDLYYCDCTPEALAARKGENKTPGYDGFCRDRGLGPGERRALRFKRPLEGSIVVRDEVRGEVTFETRALEDFVVARANGDVLYALANVVDDRDDRVTHVIRGEEHLANAPKQMLLWEALNAATGEVVALPRYAHLPLLVNEQRKKLSKRKDPVATERYRDEGYLASAFVNYLALLGWSPRGDEEIVPLAELVAQFRLGDVVPSPAFFDVKKLRAMNGAYLRALSPAAFVEAARPWVAPWSSAWAPSTTPPWREGDFDEALFACVAPLVHERVNVLGEVPAMVGFFFVTPTLDEDAAAKVYRDDPAGLAILRALEAEFATSPWTSAALHELTLRVGEAQGLNLRKAQAPLRLAVTGSLVGPPLFESLEVLGRDEVLTRVRAVLAAYA
ncbi:MAG: glutamate--tRNA ligase [Acidobacteriota bacterium]|nr:glutamate--tRNA ligase [Acidobacteriota bacterium]MDE3108124.1 glutamate--tRNA ligase [Acidobacteriota bacterium]